MGGTQGAAFAAAGGARTGPGVSQNSPTHWARTGSSEGFIFQWPVLEGVLECEMVGLKSNPPGRGEARARTAGSVWESGAERAAWVSLSERWSPTQER